PVVCRCELLSPRASRHRRHSPPCPEPRTSPKSLPGGGGRLQLSPSSKTRRISGLKEGEDRAFRLLFVVATLDTDHHASSRRWTCQVVALRFVATTQLLNQCIRSSAGAFAASRWRANASFFSTNRSRSR